MQVWKKRGLIAERLELDRHAYLSCSSSDSDDWALEKYRQCAEAWRHFAGWREKAFAGYLAGLAALAAAAFNTHDLGLRIAVLGAGLVVSIVFWLLDARNNLMLNACQWQAGRLEGGRGIFCALNLCRSGQLFDLDTYTGAVDVLVATVVGATCGGACFLWKRQHSEGVDPAFLPCVLLGG